MTENKITNLPCPDFVLKAVKSNVKVLAINYSTRSIITCYLEALMEMNLHYSVTDTIVEEFPELTKAIVEAQLKSGLQVFVKLGGED